MKNIIAQLGVPDHYRHSTAESGYEAEGFQSFHTAILSAWSPECSIAKLAPWPSSPGKPFVIRNY